MSSVAVLGPLTLISLVLSLHSPDAPVAAGNRGPCSLWPTSRIVSVNTPTILGQPRTWYYQGRHANEVRFLLSRVGGWSVEVTDLRTPEIDLEGTCSRDVAVAAAITKAFGAEAYAAQGQPGKAAEWADLMHEDLASANELCSSATSASGGSDCGTLKYWPCPGPF